jgi:hypothetical protein
MIITMLAASWGLAAQQELLGMGMGVEWIAVGIFAAGALLRSQGGSTFDLLIYSIWVFGFPAGVFVGYQWRDRISQERRERHRAQRERAARQSVR